MERIPGIYRLLILASLTFVVTLASYTSASATVIFSWSGLPIVGEREDFFPTGWASFEVSNSTLIITMTNTTSDTSWASGELLTGLVWDINSSSSVILEPRSTNGAVMNDSELIGFDALKFNPQPQDLSSEWGFRSDINAGSSALGPLGSFGIGTMGDINFGAASFGVGDRFDTSTNLFGPDSLNGIETGIVGFRIDLARDGFPNQGPLVQGNGSVTYENGKETDSIRVAGAGQMVFTFDISGDLQEGDIENVQPLFGTDGAPLTPEPGTLLLVGSGLAGLAGYAKLRLRRKKE